MANQGSTNVTDVMDVENESLIPGEVGFYLLTVVLSVVCNVIVLVLVRQQQELQENMRVLYQTLAISNLVAGIIWGSWGPFWFSFSDRDTCMILSLAVPFIFHVAFWTIMICHLGISVNLYILITRPLRYSVIMTRTRFVTMLTVVLLCTILICGLYLPIPESPFVILLAQRCMGKTTRPRADLVSIVHTLHFAFPVCVTMCLTTVLYTKLLFIACGKASVAHNSGREIRAHLEPRSDRGNIEPLRSPGIEPDLPRLPSRRIKGLTTVVLLIGSFYLVWASFIVYYTVPLSPEAIAVLDKFAVSSTWMQPIVYLLTNPEARALFMKLFGCVRPLAISI
ncbi:alpha-1B adrenergic receptor-like [Lytechinus variegatus]|uniref:alpha-1B adrenergic receptor-like n=1 Tax=Lytechinus variegatus TaxID=7654 RepID=UPI001BB17FD0|nr:alpha-1B adrenergic receptor-like [Lytechinus variegatus]